MRELPVRRLASTALCAFLLVGIAGPAAVAADSVRERTPASSSGPVPGADGLLAQVKNLGELGDVLPPVTKLLNAVLKADSGHLSVAEAQKLVDAVKDAIAKITPATAKDLKGDTLTALKKAVDTLLAAITSGDDDKVAPAVTGVVTALARVLAATAVG
ncbi:hypothetical protein GCM10022403_067840 [Streptomyces coacervatus]|uniref:Secreted protein n=1 Tax=Streptomyces coacervatus TaxID=647381 RepID=A0ABP7IRH4_9ACTN|nr:hypothetical protein [Streptomyces coacervatus]MDF2266792.1 hypothetical protein [Streptomyces coacervatus]